MKIYRRSDGWILETGDGRLKLLPPEPSITTREDLGEYLARSEGKGFSAEDLGQLGLLQPIESQEVWAAGVTFFRSREARIEESKTQSGGDFYDRVYTAERPELFFKGLPYRVAGPGQPVRIRRDSQWNVPEPELAVLISPGARILGYTIGNDMSSRDIEGENPLYLPQAKVYDRSCALGPAILVSREAMPASTEIRLEIQRNGASVFTGATTLAEMKRTPETLVEYLFRESSFPQGCILMTGTGVVPSDSFTLQHGDGIAITIDGIGTLRNTVE